MFGYVLPEKPEMKIKDYELFRAYYCGLCKSIGRQYGQLKRLLLNYDSTFLAVLLFSISDDKPEINSEKCIVHHIKKRHVVKNSAIVDYAADINILLAYYNLEDKRLDNDMLIAGPAVLALKRSYKKIRNKYKSKCHLIEIQLKALQKLEEEKCNSMDKAAEPFARLMEEIVTYEPLLQEPGPYKIIRWIGYNLGKWIYLLDAFDDIEKDIERKNYNPLIYQFEYKGEDIGEFKQRIRERVEFNLTYSLSQISKAYELLDKKNNTGILQNILYLGMLKKTETILGTRSCSKIGESI
jgi:hypothetical protein